ncbi:OmpH family outer membrane protein [Petrimonas mucosa]|jgi:outer membrane protein|uniref:Chaperone protein Skp n=1 Tax=Petrimonas mucosa TaxID=1642646 RepID=A0A1G4G486_9BACT|nr:OmpH family outer membrane protein [Petrimonas mucosa]MDD3561035.1 OmpH family outer membrane protein [Petrimonas mucosa]SCM55622.1 Chaperone protein Skp [Petrimonas mucosa]SFU53142.1 periplasmic chaperone for outer membrane proteins Skp [Porphyromonadaceae bacterium KHP3R9]HHT29447.1 OmpH family outer membrane protein [Petrimonas mucosa]
MKRRLFLVGLLLALTIGTSYAQKYAFIDMEYILGKIPAYEEGNKQLETLSKQWQEELDQAGREVEAMYKKYQADLVFLAGEEKTKRENEIVAKENEINTLRNKYFGQQGELFKRREAIMKPIQDSIYNAVKEIATANSYQAVVDRASATSVIFASPEIDISDQVLARLGY